MKRQSLSTVAVDAAAQPKAIAHNRWHREGPDRDGAAPVRAAARLQAQAVRAARPEVECIAKGRARTPYGVRREDRGYYRGVRLPQGVRLLLSHAGGLPKALNRLLKHRQAIEPTIGHMKTDGLLARNWLKGSDGHAIHAVLCGAGHSARHDLRLIFSRRTCGCLSCS